MSVLGMENPGRVLALVLAGAAIAVMGVPAPAQDGGEGGAAPSDESGEPPEKGASDAPEDGGEDGGEAEQSEGAESEGDAEQALPGLDEMLGIEAESGGGSGAGPRDGDRREPPEAADPSEGALERELSGQPPGERFQQAVALMDRTAARLTESRDASIETQRLQEDILRKLDQVIESAQQQPSSSSSSSSSGSSSSGSRQQPQQSGRQRRGGDASESESGAPPARRDGDLAASPARGAAWGRLPPRVRDALMEGLSDPFSAMYRGLTESYYERLAEDDS